MTILFLGLLFAGITNYTQETEINSLQEKLNDYEIIRPANPTLHTGLSEMQNYTKTEKIYVKWEMSDEMWK